jgi:hypothetical protein
MMSQIAAGNLIYDLGRPAGGIPFIVRRIGKRRRKSIAWGRVEKSGCNAGHDT